MSQLRARLVGLGIGPLQDILGRKALQPLHAPQQARLEVHHPIGIPEVARQLGERALHLAGPLAEVASLQRSGLRPPLLRPQRLPAVGIEQPRVRPRIVLQHLPVALQLPFGRVLRPDVSHRYEQRQHAGKYSEARAKAHCWYPRVREDISATSLSCCQIGRACHSVSILIPRAA